MVNFTGVNISNPEAGVAHTGSGGKCTAGSECPENSTYPTPCAPGSYSPLDGAASCSPCPNGLFLRF